MMLWTPGAAILCRKPVDVIVYAGTRYLRLTSTACLASILQAGRVLSISANFVARYFSTDADVFSKLARSRPCAEDDRDEWPLKYA